MSTRSMVAMKIGGKYKAIYIHFDGYLDGVGLTLFYCYQDPKKIAKLILAGDRACLNDEVDDAVYDGQYKIECDSINELIEKFKDMWTEYLYLYEDCHWKVLYKYDTPAVFKDLRSELGVEDSDDSVDFVKTKDTTDTDIADNLINDVEIIARIINELFKAENDNLTIKEFREKFCK